jgi:hypothetical protein
MGVENEIAIASIIQLPPRRIAAIVPMIVKGHDLKHRPEPALPKVKNRQSPKRRTASSKIAMEQEEFRRFLSQSLHPHQLFHAAMPKTGKRAHNIPCRCRRRLVQHQHVRGHAQPIDSSYHGFPTGILIQLHKSKRGLRSLAANRKLHRPAFGLVDHPVPDPSNQLLQPDPARHRNHRQRRRFLTAAAKAAAQQNQAQKLHTESIFTQHPSGSRSENSLVCVFGFRLQNTNRNPTYPGDVVAQPCWIPAPCRSLSTGASRL